MLRGGCSLTGTVPRPLGSASGSGWEAFAQSHLPGDTLSRRWDRARGRGWERDTDEVIGWLVRLAQASAPLVGDGSELSCGPEPDQSRAAPRRSGPGVTSHRQLPSDLVASVQRGSRLAAAVSRLVHGDLWPGNVILGPSGPGVVDWELAALGHPLGDALTYLVTTHRQLAGPATTLAEAGVAALTGAATNTERWLRRVLAAVGMAGLSPTDLDDLVMAELAAAADRPAPGGAPDQVRAREWTDCLLAVWQRWQAAGSSPWGGTATRLR